MKLSRLVLPVAAALLAAAPLLPAAQAAPAQPARQPHGKLAFVVTTAFDDIQTMNVRLQQTAFARLGIAPPIWIRSRTRW